MKKWTEDAYGWLHTSDHGCNLTVIPDHIPLTYDGRCVAQRWRWLVQRHGAVVAEGAAPTLNAAMNAALRCAARAPAAPAAQQGESS